MKKALNILNKERFFKEYLNHVDARSCFYFINGMISFAFESGFITEIEKEVLESINDETHEDFKHSSNDE